LQNCLLDKASPFMERTTGINKKVLDHPFGYAIQTIEIGGPTLLTSYRRMY
jgi:hypothetical protein